MEEFIVSVIRDLPAQALSYQISDEQAYNFDGMQDNLLVDMEQIDPKKPDKPIHPDKP